MARGQAQAADTTRKTTMGIGNQQFGQAGALEGSLVPAYTSLMDTGYFNPQEETAAGEDIMGSTAAPFATAKFTAGNRAAATHNASDLTGEEEQLALDQGTAEASAANKLQEQKMQNQEAGAYGLEQLFGENLKAGESMYGLQPGLLQARAAGVGWAQGFKDVLGTFRGGGGGFGGGEGA